MPFYKKNFVLILLPFFPKYASKFFSRNIFCQFNELHKLILTVNAFIFFLGKLTNAKFSRKRFWL